MKSLHGLSLIAGSVMLYASMTCVHVPAARVNMPPETYSFSNTTEKVSEEKTPESRIIREDFTQVELPAYTRGIYLSNNSAVSSARLDVFIREALAARLNTLVVDVQPKMISPEAVLKIRKAGLFPVARVVCFHGGLRTRVPVEAQVQRILDTMVTSARNGFAEVQLDYIRFADEAAMIRLPRAHKYAVIAGVLERARKVADLQGIYIGADVFGRITLNKDDQIGQKLENFAQYMHTLYPMLYPSHYNFDSKRMKNPYSTVKEGVMNSKKRIPQARIVAYIQGFTMLVKPTGLSFAEYIRQQIQACRDAGGDGWVIWNPRNVYDVSYAAIQKEESRLALKDSEKPEMREGLQNLTIKKLKPEPERKDPENCVNCKSSIGG